MEREVGGGIGMENTCTPMAVSFQCMTKSTTNKKKEKKEETHYMYDITGILYDITHIPYDITILYS